MTIEEKYEALRVTCLELERKRDNLEQKIGRDRKHIEQEKENFEVYIKEKEGKLEADILHKEHLRRDYIKLIEALHVLERLKNPDDKE